MTLTIGSGVRHRCSGWAGHITHMRPVDQRTLVTVKPTRPRPLEVFDNESGEFVPTPEDWKGWEPKNVYLDELVPFAAADYPEAEREVNDA